VLLAAAVTAGAILGTSPIEGNRRLLAFAAVALGVWGPVELAAALYLRANKTFVCRSGQPAAAKDDASRPDPPPPRPPRRVTGACDGERTKGLGMSASGFLWSDAWVLLALLYAQKPAPRERIRAAGDYINHAVMTDAELDGGLARLAAAGLVNNSPTGWVVTG